MRPEVMAACRSHVGWEHRVGNRMIEIIGRIVEQCRVGDSDLRKRLARGTDVGEHGRIVLSRGMLIELLVVVGSRRKIVEADHALMGLLAMVIVEWVV